MGTLRLPELDPSPEDDSDLLKKSFDGLGTDEKTLIRILGHRSASQRKKIRETYQQLYNKSLIDCLDSELSGDFGKAVILWTLEPAERDTKLANEALRTKKISVKNLQVIVEIACASSPHHLMAVRQVYCTLFNCSLEEDIIDTVSNPMRKLLVGLVSSYRYDKEVIDSVGAKSEAATLYEAIKAKKLDNSNVVCILSTRNIFQLRSTFEAYAQAYGHSIRQDVEKSGTGDLESLLKVVILCIESPEKHFAEVIGTSIIGIGTDEDALTRAIVTRAEIDMMKIRGEYSNMYKSSLDDAVIGDTSGNYKDFLMTLLGAKI